MPQTDPRGYLADYVTYCPVQPEVWRRFAEIGPNLPLQLIADVRESESAPVVAGKLRDWFDANELIIHRNHILVTATFDDVFTALLPLTDWRRFIARVAALPTARLAAEVAAVAERRPPTQRAEGGVDWGIDDRARLRWLLDAVAQVYPEPEPGNGPSGTGHVRRLLDACEAATNSEGAPLACVGFNRQVRPAVADSRRTVKADAAERLFDVDCAEITWAIIDTGIDRSHPAFAGTDGASRVVWTIDVSAGIERLKEEQTDIRFVGLLDDAAWTTFMQGALVSDEAPARRRAADVRTEHGTHVAGILGADYRPARPPRRPAHEEVPEGDLRGICPGIKLIDLRVFDQEETASEFNVIVALAFVAWANDRQILGPGNTIDGVNISLSVPFAVDSHACGWTPVCQECDHLVKSGVVVVAAAGNAGFAEGVDETSGSGFALVSISDPGNADAVITVGSTHSHEPHRYGPTARSARGPTADGRHKPDLLAPGIDILGPAPGLRWQRLSGTSMAAPHVSGVAAMLLSRFPELRGQPEVVKDILCGSATDLRRLPDFQGHGLIDALRALQAH